MSLEKRMQVWQLYNDTPPKRPLSQRYIEWAERKTAQLSNPGGFRIVQEARTLGERISRRFKK